MKLSLSRDAWQWFRKMGGVDLAGLFAKEEPARRRKRRLGAGRPDIFYARVARRYVDAAPNFRGAVKRIARKMRQSPEKVRDMILTARRRGLLSPAPVQGKGGGQLTPTALDLLRRRTRKRR